MSEIDFAGLAAAHYERCAQRYGGSALRLFPFAADRLVFQLRLAPGEKVLDVATGPGTAAVAAAQLVAPRGRVMAIDIAEAMLESAQATASARGLAHLIDLHAMPGQDLEFRAGYFDAVICAAAIFFMPDPGAALGQWARVLKPGGRLMFTTFGPRAFAPLEGMHRAALQEHLPEPVLAAAPDWHCLPTPQECATLLVQAGFRDVKVESVQLGYHLRGADDWWEFLSVSGLALADDLLDPPALAGLRQRVIAGTQALVGEQGLWLDAETLFAFGRRP